MQTTELRRILQSAALAMSVTIAAPIVASAQEAGATGAQTTTRTDIDDTDDDRDWGWLGLLGLAGLLGMRRREDHVTRVDTSTTRRP